MKLGKKLSTSKILRRLSMRREATTSPGESAANNMAARKIMSEPPSDRPDDAPIGAKQPQFTEVDDRLKSLVISRQAITSPPSISSQEPNVATPNRPCPTMTDAIVSSSPVEEHKGSFVGRNGWLVLKEVLKIARDASDQFWPVKTVLVPLVGLMEHVESVHGTQQRFLELADKIRTYELIFSRYKETVNVPTYMYDRLDGMVEKLKSIKVAAERKTQRGLPSRAIHVYEDVKDIVDMTDELASALEILKARSIVETHLGVHNLVTMDALKGLQHVAGAGINALKEDGCMEGTRVNILQDLQAWSANPTAPRIFWLDGMAGTGKSAIARSFARMLRAEGYLAGSFFCSRGIASRENVRRIVPTLAWFLARRCSAYREALVPILQESPDIAENTVDEQIECLLSRPFEDLRFHAEDAPLVFIIDALDECASANETQMLLNKLLSPSLHIPLKFFLTSRAEPHIRLQLNSLKTSLRQILRLHDIEQDLVQADISRYVDKQLHLIRSSSPYPGIFPAEWPTAADVTGLARQAGKLFIHAFTAIMYVQGENPVKRLKTLISPRAVDNEPLNTRLDKMYELVLFPAMDSRIRTKEEISDTKRILLAMLTIRELLSISKLARILGMNVDDVCWKLHLLHAVVYIPSDPDVGMVSTFHASFGDFLTNPGRAPAHMFLDLSMGHYNLVDCCLTLMDSELYFNISGCQTSYLPNSAQELQRLPLYLKYACVHWPYHLAQATGSLSIIHKLREVFSQRFLFWLEALSAMELAKIASSLIRVALTSQLIYQDVVSDTVDLLQDINFFIISSQAVLETSVAHIYLSALPALARQCQAAQALLPNFVNIPEVHSQNVLIEQRAILCIHGIGRDCIALSPDGKIIASVSFDDKIQLWSAQTGEMMTLFSEGHESKVISIAFSPNGRYIASGAYDDTIRIWSVQTGKRIYEPLEGHTERITSVIFSPDSKYIASGSADKTIRIWRISTRELVLEPLRGHTYWITSLAYSPNSKILASGSLDETIRIWNTENGEVVMHPLEDHTAEITCVIFSPDGKYLASGSRDKTIRIWSTETGEVMTILEGHKDWVTYITFSFDSQYIASGSDDCTVRVWDIRSGSMIMQPLEGHTDWITFVAFTLDSRNVISGSDDHTIRVWNIMQGRETILQLPPGHTHKVTSVIFSPDEKYIASSSYDTSIRIWNVVTGDIIIQPLQGHLGRITTIAFSSDSKYIVSGSADKTVRIWDIQTGALVLQPLQGHTQAVTSVAFSPDNKLIASGSDDQTVRIWDMHTGRMPMHPLKDYKTLSLSVMFSLDGQYITSGSYDNSIKVWNAQTGEIPSRGHISQVNSLSFSPDDEYLVSGSDDHKVRVWDIQTGRLRMQPFEGHTVVVTSVAFSPSGKYIVSGSNDRMIRFWRHDANINATTSMDCKGILGI
ncbi:WD40 repeat-like protein [Panus rudis PR-1116 ss-1]|nr:WD40 repeat-like protein [Panus rudis PR-1116 ss-1]